MIHTIIALVLAAGAPNAQALPDRPCKYEDSTNCVWDAKHMGNGSGKSFADINGETIFISHRVAHRLLR